MGGWVSAPTPAQQFTIDALLGIQRRLCFIAVSDVRCKCGDVQADAIVERRHRIFINHFPCDSDLRRMLELVSEQRSDIDLDSAIVDINLQEPPSITARAD